MSDNKDDAYKFFRERIEEERKQDAYEAEHPNLYQEQEEKDIQLFMKNYHLFNVLFANAFLGYLEIMFFLVSLENYNILSLEPGLFAALLVGAALVLGLPLFFFIFKKKLYTCPVCQSFMHINHNPREITYHCCCVCGKHIYEHPSFSKKLMRTLLILGVACLLLAAVLGFSLLVPPLVATLLLLCGVHAMGNFVVFFWWTVVAPEFASIF